MPSTATPTPSRREKNGLKPGKTRRAVLHSRRFSEMAAALRETGPRRVDGFVMDIAWLDASLTKAIALRVFARGSAVHADDREGLAPPTSSTKPPKARSQTCCVQYGEEPQSRRVARANCRRAHVATTGDLARLVRKALGLPRPAPPKDPATPQLPGNPLHVNASSTNSKQACWRHRSFWRGRSLGVVAFHSLGTASSSASCAAPRSPARLAPSPPSRDACAHFDRVAKAVKPSEPEIARNPRARSSVLRAAVRTATPFEQAADGLAAHQAGSRLRQASWAATLSAALTLFLALTFHVNAIEARSASPSARSCRSNAKSCCARPNFSRASQRQLS